MVTHRNKIILLDVVNGDFNSGFRVFLRIGDHEEFQSELPSDPEIPQLYDQWRSSYGCWGERYQWGRLNFQTQITHVDIDEFAHREYEKSKQVCNNAANALEKRLQEWFDRPKLRDLREHIVLAAKRYHLSRLIVRTDNYYLRRLPWHLWPLLERLDDLEIVISNQTYKKSRQLSNPVKILCVLGNSQGIDTQVDSNLLNTLPYAIVERLVEPTPNELQNYLFNRYWDILFFAGHSHSGDNDSTGFIWLNKTNKIPLSELKEAIKCAAKNGLQIAIFNSCDGLGLAQELADLQIPYLIVMREPVPDRIAQKFLEYFLLAFAQGKPFHLAVRQARERLRSLERMEPDYPYASWLPMICQNPAAPILKYPRFNPYKIASIGIAGTIALAIAGTVLYQNWQNSRLLARMSLGEKVLVTEVTNTNKVAGTNAFHRGDFTMAVKQFEDSLQQYRNDPETLIYLNNARIGLRPALKIAVGVPIGSNPNVAQEMLRGVAQSQDGVNRQGGIAGRLLQVEIANDDNKPEVAVSIAKQFLKDPQILAVVGHNVSDASVAAAPIYNQGGLVMITPTSFSDKLSSIGPYIFRMVPSIRFLADKLAGSYIKIHPYANIATCSEESSVDNESFRNQFTNGVLAQNSTQPVVNNSSGFENQFTNGVLAQTANHPDVKLEKYPCDFSAKNFDSNVTIANLIQRGVDTLLLSPHVDRINKATDIARANHGRLRLLGSPTLYTSATLELGKSAVNDLLLEAPWYSNLSNDDPFSREAAKLWGGPVNWRTAMSYDATKVIVSGLKQIIETGVQITPTREKLKDALRNSEFSVKGASGTIRFIQSGERQIDANLGILVQVKPVPSSQFGYDFVPLSSVQQTSNSPIAP